MANREPDDRQEDSVGGLSIIGAGTLLVPGDGSAPNLGLVAPFSNKILLYPDVPIAGTSRIKDMDYLVGMMAEGQKLRLVHDVGNLVSQWAVKVYYENYHLGYVSADVNAPVARLLDGGKNVFGELSSAQDMCGWFKLLMGVYLDD